jgi:glycosyltransferase involved in cell wall biosynthesis
MMRIAVVTRYFPSSLEPWQGRSAFQTLRLVAREADVRVFYPHASYPPLLKPSTGTHGKLDPSFRPPDIKASYYDYLALPVISRPLNGWMVYRALLPSIRRFAPDLIFGVYLNPDGYAALKIGRALSVPVVTMSIGSDINNISDRISARYTKIVLRESDYVVTVSDDLRRKAVIMGASPEASRAITNGCDLSVFHVKDRLEARRKLKIDSDSKTVVYIGRMDVKKGLVELVDAAAAIQPTRPKLQVYMVGEGPDRPIIENAIHVHGADSYIHLMPPCKFDDVAIWMASADLVTLPSYMEGCPNVVLEALACGRPVVATNVGGIPEILSPECGRLIPARDAGQLAEALTSVLDSTWDAAEISARGSRSWNAVSSELLEVFESLVPTVQACDSGR